VSRKCIFSATRQCQPETEKLKTIHICQKFISTRNLSTK
jgi:hypothetical protein